MQWQLAPYEVYMISARGTYMSQEDICSRHHIRIRLKPQCLIGILYIQLDLDLLLGLGFEVFEDIGIHLGKILDGFDAEGTKELLGRTE